MPIYKINESSEMAITEGVISDIINSIKDGASNLKQSVLDLFKSKLEKGCTIDYALKLKYRFDKKITVEQASCDPRVLKLFVKYVKESEKLYEEVEGIFKEIENLYNAKNIMPNMVINYGDFEKISKKADEFNKKCKKVLEDGIGSEFKAIKDLNNDIADINLIEVYIDRYRKSVRKLAFDIIDINNKYQVDKSNQSLQAFKILADIAKTAEQYLTIDDEESPKVFDMLYSIKIKGKYGKR